MADVQVTCITKPHPQSPHEHITHVGNPKRGVELAAGTCGREHRDEDKHLLCARPKVGKARGHRRCAGGWARSVSTQLCRRLLER